MVIKLYYIFLSGGRSRCFGNVSKRNVTLVRHERLGNNICNGDRSTVVVCVLCPTFWEKWFRVRRLPTDLLFFSRQWRWLIVKDVEVTQRVNTPRAPVHLVNEMFCVTRITVRAVCTMRPILFWNGFDYNYPACIPRADLANMHPQ